MRVVFLVCFFLCAGLLAESAISVVGDIGKEIEKIESKLVKGLLEQKVSEAWELKNEAQKLTELKKILSEVKKLNLDKKADGPVNVDLNKEISLCNYLVGQACLLEALDGHGVALVRNELTGNFNDHGISLEGKRLLRRLVSLCEEAERGYKNVSYVEKDGSKAKADLLATNVGAGVGISLALGDVTPLVAAAVRIGRGYHGINKTKSRQLEILIEAHKARIVNFLFNVNSRKNDIIAEHNVNANLIITPERYRSFIKILIRQDLKEKEKALLDAVKGNPEFVAAHFYLGENYFEQGMFEKARLAFSKVAKSKSPLLHKDGFVGQAYTYLSKIDLQEKHFEQGVLSASAALKENPSNSRALSVRSFHFMNLKQYGKSWEDGLKAHKANPTNAEYCWALCKIASLMKSDLSLVWLEKAIDRGFRDFDQVRKWSSLEETLKSLKAQALIAPQISAIYKAGVFKDDIILTNNSRFVLDDFRAFVEVSYLKKGKNISFELAAAKTVFEKEAKIEFKNKFSMSKTSKCTITITFTSKQNPEKIRTVVHYNAKGKKKHLFNWQLETEEAWQIIMTSNDKTKLEEAIEKLKGVAQKSKLESSHIISGIAHALHKLGNKEEAVKMQQKAIKILKEHVPDKIYDLTVIPYKRALEKFKELTKGK